MALITCPECQHDISDKALACPHCGNPLRSGAPPGNKTGLWWGLGCLLAIPALLGVVAVVGLLAAIAIPSFVKARNESQKHVCLVNLRLLGSAKDQAAKELRLQPGDPLTPAQVEPFLKGGLAARVCPAGGRYSLCPIGADPLCTVHGRLSEVRTTAMRPALPVDTAP